MRTLKSWWSFANDATKLSDAEQVAKGQENWSPLAQVALETAANLIQDRVLPDGEWEWSIEGALQEHPQAFEELSLSIGAALEAMWRVVPEAKADTFRDVDSGKYTSTLAEAKPAAMPECHGCGRFPCDGTHAECELATYAAHRGTTAQALTESYKAKREEWKMESGYSLVFTGGPNEDIVLPEVARGETLTFSNLPETDPAKLREQMLANLKALHDSVVEAPRPVVFDPVRKTWHPL